MGLQKRPLINNFCFLLYIINQRPQIQKLLEMIVGQKQCLMSSHILVYTITNNRSNAACIMGTISTLEGLEGIFDLVDQNLQVIRQETNIWSLTILYLFVKFVYNCAITCNCVIKCR